MSTPGASGTPGMSASSVAALGRDGKPNKGIILKKSVDYIRQLQLAQEELRRKNEELEKRLVMLGQPTLKEDNKLANVSNGSSGKSFQDDFKTTPSKSDNDDYADFDYDESVFPTSPGLSDEIGGGQYNGMDIS